jgi:hypothetical protein
MVIQLAGCDFSAVFGNIKRKNINSPSKLRPMQVEEGVLKSDSKLISSILGMYDNGDMTTHYTNTMRDKRSQWARI